MLSSPLDWQHILEQISLYGFEFFMYSAWQKEYSFIEDFSFIASRISARLGFSNFERELAVSLLKCSDNTITSRIESIQVLQKVL